MSISLCPLGFSRIATSPKMGKIDKPLFPEHELYADNFHENAVILLTCRDQIIALKIRIDYVKNITTSCCCLQFPAEQELLSDLNFNHESCK
jgi:hypothetical protein